MLTDYLMLNIGWLCFNVLRYFSLPVPLQFGLGNWLATPAPLLGQLLVPLMMMAVYWLTGYYNQVYYKSRLAELGNTAVVSFAGMLVIYFAVLIDDGIPERMQNYELLGATVAYAFCAGVCGPLRNHQPCDRAHTSRRTRIQCAGGR